MRFPYRNRLGYKAAIAVALPMFAILLIASIASGVLSYRFANLQLEERVQDIALDDFGHIADHLWELDIEAVQSQLDSYVVLAGITGARVVDLSGTVIQSGTLGEDPSAFVVTASLPHPRGDSKGALGTLTLEASRDQSLITARNRIFAVIALGTITVLISLALILRLLDQRVISPIEQIERELRQRPGDWHDFRIDLDRLDHTVELDQLVGSIHEMRDHILATQSESAYNQSRLAQAAQLAQLGYATSDQFLDRILECDERYAAMHGKTVDEMLRLSILKDIIEGMSHPEDRAAGLALQQRLKRGESLAVTARVRVGSEEYRYLQKTFSAKKIPDGRTGVVDIVAQDVTELHVMKEHLLQTQKMEAIGKLTGGVAHDFNNILAIVGGNLELIRDDTHEEPLASYVDTAQIAVRRGATLTQRLLAFARKQTLQPEVTDIAKLVRDSENLIRTSIGATIKLRIQADDHTANATVDRAQLEAVLLNLIVNARDAMPDGGRLVIKVENTNVSHDSKADDQDVIPEDYVCISVTDSGVGMSAETAEKAFDPFFTTKEVGKGTGLGLSMAFGFAKQSGGHLKIESTPGKGTTIMLYLLRVQTVSSSEVTLAAGGPAEALKGLHVLLVEDDENLRETIQNQLESLGCIVASAADGKSAVALARDRRKIDILLSDVVLPGMLNGRMVAREITGIFPRCPVVLMSGYVDVSEPEGGFCDEMGGLLQKPFSLASLRQALTSSIAA